MSADYKSRQKNKEYNKKYLRGEVLGEEAVGLEAAAGHDDEDVERRLAARSPSKGQKSKNNERDGYIYLL